MDDDHAEHKLPAMKTNAMRILDTLGIHCDIREYEVDPDDLSAERIASDIGLPPEQVFKTLLARGVDCNICRVCSRLSASKARRIAIAQIAPP